jgi:hypothetical protein
MAKLIAHVCVCVAVFILGASQFDCGRVVLGRSDTVYTCNWAHLG